MMTLILRLFKNRTGLKVNFLVFLGLRLFFDINSDVIKAAIIVRTSSIAVFSDIQSCDYNAATVECNRTELSKTHINNIRCISLLSSLGKCLQMLRMNRLNYHLRESSFLPEDQYGFAPPKSAEDALVHL